MEDDLQPEANDDDAAPDASRTVDGANGVLTVLTPVDLPHLLIDLKLPQRLLNLALFTTLSFAPSPMQPSLHPPTTAILSVLHLRALETLNNLFLTTVASLTPTASMTSAFPAQTIWDGLLRIVSQLVQEMIEMQMNDLERKPRKIVISAVMGRAEKAEMDVEGVGLKGQELKGDVLEMAMGCLWGLVKIASAASSQLVSPYSLFDFA